MRLVLPSQDIAYDAWFLVDTGADLVYISGRDAGLMGYDHSRARTRDETTGVGGVRRDYVEYGWIIVDDGERVYGYYVPLRIAGPENQDAALPSALGRAVLDQWQLLFRAMDQRLEIEVLTATRAAPLSPDYPPIEPADLHD